MKTKKNIEIAIEDIITIGFRENGKGTSHKEFDLIIKARFNNKKDAVKAYNKLRRLL